MAAGRRQRAGPGLPNRQLRHGPHASLDRGLSAARSSAASAARSSDLAVGDVDVDFRDVTLTTPLALAGATIDVVTLAVVTVRGVDRRGRMATGRGAAMLSVPWSWPRSRHSVAERDGVLRDLTKRLAALLIGAAAGDPFSHWRALEAELDGTAAAVAATRRLGEPVPRLAAMLALGAADNAVHDAWARGAQRPAWSLYDGDHLADDLAGQLGDGAGEGGRGRYPGELLGPRRVRLEVQHVVGVDEDVPIELLRRDGIRHVKLKVAGRDPATDAQRIADVHAGLVAVSGGDVTVAVDPNEGYGDLAGAAELVHRLCSDHPAAMAAVRYLEQPIPREATADRRLMGEIGHIVPVLVDEGWDRVDDLAELAGDGWSGIVVKASKGQSAGLLAYSFARLHGLAVTVQDLTAVDVALEHSARLASQLDLTAPGFECNSRQYAPAANAGLARRRPELVDVRDGAIEVGEATAPGLL